MQRLVVDGSLETHTISIVTHYPRPDATEEGVIADGDLIIIDVMTQSCDKTKKEWRRRMFTYLQQYLRIEDCI